MVERKSYMLSDCIYANLKYNKNEMYEKFDNQLKEINKEYRTTIINFNKYPLINFAMAKVIKMTKEEQNQAVLYLFNSIN